jgi:hypothetical protein
LASVGSTSRFSPVEVISPPRITIAIGPSVSRPGSPLPMARGNRPKPETSGQGQVIAKSEPGNLLDNSK